MSAADYITTQTSHKEDKDLKTNTIITTLTALLILATLAGSAMCLPSTFDWRDVDGTNYVSPVKNQIPCGACYAFGAVAALEMFIQTHGGGEMDLSEEQAKECAGYGCAGGMADRVFGMYSITGSVTEADDPYHAYNTECNQDTTPVVRVTGWKELSYGDRDEIKSYIYNYGHAVVTVLSCHTVVLIGWNDTEGHWIYKNSYGPSWWYGGFGYRDYGTYTDNHIKSITGYEPYDDMVKTCTHAENGATYGIGYHPSNVAWGMALLTVVAGEGITKIEFDTTGSTSDIDLYIYDGYDGTSLGNLLYSVTDLSYDTAGFYSVGLPDPLVMDTTTEVAVVARFVNTGTQANLNGYRPIAVDTHGSDSGKTFASQTGADGSWSPAEYFSMGGDVTLRLRVADRIRAPLVVCPPHNGQDVYAKRLVVTGTRIEAEGDVTEEVSLYGYRNTATLTNIYNERIYFQTYRGYGNKVYLPSYSHPIIFDDGYNNVVYVGSGVYYQS